MLLTIIPFITIEHWSIRIFDFPHLQLTIITGGILLVCLYRYFKERSISPVFVILLLISWIYQISKILPYTSLRDFEVENASPAVTERLSIYTCNVLQENSERKLVIDDAKQFDADILLFTETNEAWIEYLNENLKNQYRHKISMPLENTYGMVLYSKYKLIQSSIKYLVEDTIPSIHTRIVLPSKKQLQVYAIHPAPPTPLHNPRSLDRDAELMKIGRLSRTSKLPVVVLGDFNDVAWSETTRLFQLSSGLLDLRKGRGLFNTYNADYWFIRWPLDHVFVSPEFRVAKVGLGDNVGSDHFPFFTELSIEPTKSFEQQLPEPKEEVIKEAKEQIQEERDNNSNGL